MGHWLERMRMHGRRGFSLIELMIATVVMSVGLFAIIHLQVVVVRGNSYSREISEATELADAACEYLRLQALNWLDTGPGPNPPLTSVPYFNACLISAPPAQGINFNTLAGLDSLPDLSVHPDISPVVISTGPGPANAKALTAGGLPADLAPGREALRTLFRIHYLAYPTRLTPVGAPSNDLITVVVFVSWDNKDHGAQQQDWAAWWNAGTFFDRHMVVKRVLLQPKRIW